MATTPLGRICFLLAQVSSQILTYILQLFVWYLNVEVVKGTKRRPFIPSWRKRPVLASALLLLRGSATTPSTATVMFVWANNMQETLNLAKRSSTSRGFSCPVGAMHLDSMIEASRLPSTLGTREEVEKAEKALGTIINLLEDAHSQSERYSIREGPEVTEALDPNQSRIHQKVHRIIKHRQRTNRFMDKASWALYGKRDLNDLVEDVSDMTTQLINLFPATKPRQEELSADEVGQIDDENLPALKEVADAQDSILPEAVQNVMQARGHTFYKAHARNGAASHNGDLIGQGYRGLTGGLSHSYQEPLAEGQGTRQHNGNVYGAKTSMYGS